MITLTSEQRRLIQQAGRRRHRDHGHGDRYRLLPVRAEVFRCMQEFPEGERASPNWQLFSPLWMRSRRSSRG